MKKENFHIKNWTVIGCMFGTLLCSVHASQSPYQDAGAEFPGGTSKMYVFLGKHIHYPEKAIKANVSLGKTIVSFTVQVDSSLKNFRIVKDSGFGMGEELIRVVKTMPKWTPAKKSGKPIESEYLLPVFVDPE